MLNRLNLLGYGERSLFFPPNAIHLHAMVSSCGFSLQDGANYDWHGLRRGNAEFALFQYTLSGNGHLTFEGKEYAISTGDAMILHFPHDNRYRLPADSKNWEFIYVCLHGRDVIRIWKEIIDIRGPIVKLEASSRSVLSAITIYESATNNSTASSFGASAHAYELSMSLCDDVLTDNAHHTRLPGIEKVIEYAQSHFSDQLLDVNAMAIISGFSRYHFCRQFAKTEGVAPGQYLADLRINEAVRLLSDKSLPVKDIAYKSGFADPNYFCKAFRKKTGVAPGMLRKSGMY